MELIIRWVQFDLFIGWVQWISSLGGLVDLVSGLLIGRFDGLGWSGFGHWVGSVDLVIGFGQWIWSLGGFNGFGHWV